jgi:hypothetical protein
MSEPDSDFEPLAPTDVKNKQSVQANEGTSTVNKWDYPQWVASFQHWLTDSSTHEVRNLVDFFDRSSQWWAAATELTSDEFQQKSTYLKRDLLMFYKHYQIDMQQSDFIQAVKESAWKELAEMTDKSQIEWQELKQDFRHQGNYEAGEWIGMGIIVCKSCQYKVEFVHPEELPVCPQCGGSTFLREALAP